MQNITIVNLLYSVHMCCGLVVLDNLLEDWSGSMIYLPATKDSS